MARDRDFHGGHGVSNDDLEGHVRAKPKPDDFLERLKARLRREATRVVETPEKEKEQPPSA